MPWQYSVLPEEALKRIAFLLEAEGAPTYKVQAFRRAASTAGSAGPEHLSDLAGRGRLEDLPGIGPSTASVIAAVLSGGVPSYLEVLEARMALSGAGPSTPATQLLGTLRGDCHSHSDWSDGGSPVHEMVDAAAGLGREYLALTDHSPRLTVAHGLSAQRLTTQLELVAQVNEDQRGTRLLSGIEVDILEDGELDQDPALLDRLDVVVASVHSLLRMEEKAMTARMVRAVSNPHVDILGHCTGRIVKGRGRPQSQFDPAAVFGACAEHGTAVEVNSRPERLDPPVPLLRLAVEAGCQFAIDSDAHAPGQLSWLGNGCEQAVLAGVAAGSVVNSLPLDDFLSWVHRGGPRWG